MNKMDKDDLIDSLVLDNHINFNGSALKISRFFTAVNYLRDIVVNMTDEELDTVFNRINSIR